MNTAQLEQYRDLLARMSKTRTADAATADELVLAVDALVEEVERLRAQLAQAQRELAAREPLQLANWNLAPKWAEWHAIDADGTGHWFQKSPAMTADYWCSEMDGDSTHSAWFTLENPDDWERTREERPLPF